MACSFAAVVSVCRSRDFVSPPHPRITAMRTYLKQYRSFRKLLRPCLDLQTPQPAPASQASRTGFGLQCRMRASAGHSFQGSGAASGMTIACMGIAATVPMRAIENNKTMLQIRYITSVMGYVKLILKHLLIISVFARLEPSAPTPLPRPAAASTIP